MVELDLLIPKTDFFAGDEVTGAVILTCEKMTECKSFRVVFEGIMTAKADKQVVVGKGRLENRRFTESFVILQEEVVLGQETAFDPGTQKFEFEFKLPDDAKVSYYGHHGSIKYTISAMMNVSRRTKPTTSKSIKIIRTVDDYPDSFDEVAEGTAEHVNKNVLEIKIDSQKYCIGNKISFRYRIDADFNFDSLRARIEHKETSFLEGKIPLSHTSTLWEERIPSGKINRNEWNEWTLNINKKFPIWLNYENLNSFLNLQVTLARTFRLDKSAEVGLAAGYCSEIAGISENTEDAPVLEKKPRPTRLRCNRCSYSFKVKDDDVDSGTCPSCGKQILF